MFIPMIISTVIFSFICMIIFWYNGTLDVQMDEDGDSIKLNILEYDMIRNRRFIILFIKRNK